MASKVIGVSIDGRVEWHGASVGPTDYHTMCGIDAEDPQIGHFGTVAAKRGQKINCFQCKAIWLGVRALRLRETDFA